MLADHHDEHFAEEGRLILVQVKVLLLLVVKSIVVELVLALVVVGGHRVLFGNTLHLVSFSEQLLLLDVISIDGHELPVLLKSRHRLRVLLFAENTGELSRTVVGHH